MDPVAICENARLEHTTHGVSGPTTMCYTARAANAKKKTAVQSDQGCGGGGCWMDGYIIMAILRIGIEMDKTIASALGVVVVSDGMGTHAIYINIPTDNRLAVTSPVERTT